MNLKTFDKGTRLLKQTDLAIRGQSLQGETNKTVIGILDCTNNGNPAILENLKCGIRQGGGLSLTFNLNNYDFHQRIAPATAKYANNYINAIATNTAAIIRTQMLDGVVAIVDNYVMGLGVLIGCTISVICAPARIAIREIKAGDIDQVVNNYAYQSGTFALDTLTTDFYRLAEAFELMLPGATTVLANSCAVLDLATKTATTILQRADDIITTKRLISKRTASEKIEQYKNNHGSVSGLFMFQKIFELVDLKITPNMFDSLKTTLADQAFVVSRNNTPLQSNAPLVMEGQAWVYNTIIDAMSALTSNAIDSGIIVLQTCTDCDVSLIAHTITTMQKANSIAILTDGYCSETPVLTVAHISPDGYANQDFNNIQNGDMIEIDVTKGRITTNINSRDMKIRAKRNIAKKHEIYF